MASGRVEAQTVYLNPNNTLSYKYLVSWEGIYPLPSSPGPWAGGVLATWKGVVIQKTARFSWGLALGAYKPAKISQHKVNFSPDSLKTLIPI